MPANDGKMDATRKADLDLLQSGYFADVEVVCGDRVWNCHRVILASRSVWFRKALSGSFQEASDKRIKLDEEKPHSVALALEYIYGGGECLYFL
ncbi:hypothetical protein Daus18300_005698 [Diaporthe australafricana]|uniref:BTB domain-containing protein n=1 Tax=Diaporthe australafricana TaxID=127596 RepID=A0ABR3WZN7_9PEZI